jgi:hypothetical protein
MNVRTFAFTLLLPILIILTGCGGGKTAAAKVSGKVTLNGEAVTGGSMYFHTEAGVYTASIDEEGSFALLDVPPGEVAVTVDNEFLDPNKKTPTYTGGSSATPAMKTPGGGPAGKYGAAMSGPSGGQATQYKGKGMQIAAPPEGAATVKVGTFVKLPDLYKKRETTTIKFKIEPGNNTQNIEMTGK